MNKFAGTSIAQMYVVAGRSRRWPAVLCCVRRKNIYYNIVWKGKRAREKDRGRYDLGAIHIPSRLFVFLASTRAPPLTSTGQYRALFADLYYIVSLARTTDQVSGIYLYTHRTAHSPAARQSVRVPPIRVNPFSLKILSTALIKWSWPSSTVV